MNASGRTFRADESFVDLSINIAALRPINLLFMISSHSKLLFQYLFLFRLFVKELNFKCFSDFYDC